VPQVGGGGDLPQETLGPDSGGEIGAEDLHRHLPLVSEVIGEVDGRHPAGTEFALDAVTASECRGESGLEGGYQVPKGDAPPMRPQ
jgi:hypothetical protein